MIGTEIQKKKSLQKGKKDKKKSVGIELVDNGYEGTCLVLFRE